MNEVNFILNHMPKYVRDEFLEYLKRMTFAIKINDDPAFVKETYDDFIKKYPFTKVAFERMGLKQLSDEDIKYYKENYDK